MKFTYQFFSSFILISLITGICVTIACGPDESIGGPFPSTISGKVTDMVSNEELEGVNVEVYQGTELLGSGESSASGNYSISVEVLLEENVTVEAKVSDYEDFSKSITMTSGDQTKTINIEMQPKAKIGGVIRNEESSEALANVNVLIEPGGESITTNELGRYEFDGLDAGTYELLFSKSGFESKKTTVAVEVGEDKENDISLTAIPAVLVVDKTALDFGATETVFPIEMTNSGGDTVEWSIIESIPWASVNPLSGKITTEPTTINISVDRNGFDPGSYAQTMTIASNGGTKTISLTMTIQGAILQIIPSEISLGTEATEESIQLTRIGQGTLNYEIQSDKSWLTATPNSGSISNEVDFIQITVDRLSLAIGNHSGKLAFNTDNGSQLINVSLTVPDPTAPQLSVSPLALNFGTDDANKIVTLKNTGKGTVNWNVTKAATWLSTEVSSGALEEDESFNLLASVNRSTLDAGNFDDVLRFTSNGGDVNVPVEMEVANIPVLSIDQTTLVFKREDTQLNFAISNIGNGTMNWQVTTNKEWMTINPVSGTNNATVNINVSRDGLEFGNYSGQIDISSDGGVAQVLVEMIHQPPNDPPIADFTVSRMVADINEMIDLDASLSSDAQDDLTQLEVRWKFEIAGSFSEWTTNKLASISYSNTGIKDITLEVRDSELEFASLTKEISVVMNEAPIASFTVDPTSGEEQNTTFNFDASGSTDDIDTGDDLQVRWEWETGIGFTDWTKTKIAQRIYDTDGTKTVTLEVQDSQGLIDAFSAEIVVVSNGDLDGDGVPDIVDADDDNDGFIDIYTIDELSNVRNDLQAQGTNLQGAPDTGFIGYELMNDLDFLNDSDYNDLALKSLVTTGSGWNPIGNTSGHFITTLEGNGFTVSNLLIDRTTDYTGLFGVISGLSEIRNLNVTIKFFSAAAYAGGLVGYVDGGKIISCSSSGRVVGEFDVGVLVGRLEHGTIDGCYSTGNATGTAGGIGGLLGRAGDSSDDVSIIKNSYSSSNVSAGSSAGGLIGYANNGFTTTSSCYATGDVSSSGENIGGLAGYYWGEISSSYATGNVSSSDRYAGGLVGYMRGGTLTTSFSTGTSQAPSNVGGLIARGGASISSTNYWDTVSSGLASSVGGTGFTTSQLQSQTTADGIYITWDAALWDFGSAVQYPALKGTPGGVDIQRD